MRIDAWADLVCPWCLIERLRVQRAIADHSDDVQIVHRFVLWAQDIQPESTH